MERQGQWRILRVCHVLRVKLRTCVREKWMKWKTRPMSLHASTLYSAEAWKSFGDRRSGNTKASLLLWAAKHPEYDYVWHIEDDVFFTGRWSQCFDAALSSPADIVAEWNEVTNPNGITKFFRPEACYFEGVPCRDRKMRKVWWPVVRLSSRLMSMLRTALSQGRAKGTPDNIRQSRS